MRPPPTGAPSYGLVRERASSIVEARKRLPYGAATGWADVAPAQPPCEEPLSRPSAKSTNRRQAFDDVLVGPRAQGHEVQCSRAHRSGEAHDVLRFPHGELHAPELADARPCQH